MEQYIKKEQLNELSIEQKIRLAEWFDTENWGLSRTVIEEINDRQIILPLASAGQLIQLISEMRNIVGYKQYKNLEDNEWVIEIVVKNKKKVKKVAKDKELVNVLWKLFKKVF